MSSPAPDALLRVVLRATLGLGVVLVALHALTAATPPTGERASVRPEDVRLRVDPNVAPREELMLLPRIGPTIADYIVEFRESVRPARAFNCAQDLERVRRIGPATVAQLCPYLRFKPTEPAGRAEDRSP